MSNPATSSDVKTSDLRGRIRDIRRRVTSTLGAFLFLVPLAFIFDLAGYLPSYLRLFFIYMLMALPLCRYQKRAVLKGGLALGAVILLNAFTPLPQPAEILLLTSVHLWIWSFSGQLSGWLAQGVVFYALLHIFLFQSPLGYPLLETINRIATGFSGWIIGGPVRTGYTYQNIGSFQLFLSLSIHAWNRGMLSKVRTAVFLIAVLLLNGLLTAVLLYTVDLGPDLTWDLNFRDLLSWQVLLSYALRTTLLIFPIFLFLAHATAYLVLHHDSPSANRTLTTEAQSDHTLCTTSEAGGDNSTKNRTVYLKWAFPVLAIAALLLMIPQTSFRSARPRRITFLNRGVVSFSKPDYTRYSRAAGGMYGLVPEYAGLYGCEGEVTDEIPDPLDPDQILVITNMDAPMSREEFDRVWSFVQAGGGLWVLADHTFIKNGRNHVNDLLAPTHIRLNHDSAQFYPQGWFNSYRIRQGTPFSSLTDPAENRLSILVGCSLALRPPARPLIAGRFGYGDLGPAEKDEERGWLGDFEYQVSERLGDLVLVAGQQFGNGKVLVFGDTTSFFNLNLIRSYELLGAVLTWFGEPASLSWFSGRTAEWLVIILLVIALAASVTGRSRRPVYILLPFLALLSFVIHQAVRLPFNRELARERMALMDFSQQPYASKHANMNSGLFGVTANLMRHGMMPITQNHWNRKLLDEAALLFLNAPQRPFSRAQRRDIMQFAERGGIVLMSCGYPHYHNARSLLDSIGVEVLNIPLGRSFDRQAFGRPIHLFSPWPLKLNRPGATVLARSDEWPLIVEVPMGQGRIILIPDSEFFHNINLETMERHSQANVDFIRTLLDRARGVTAP